MTVEGGAVLVGQHGGHRLNDPEHLFTHVIGSRADGPRGHFVDEISPLHVLRRRQVLHVFVEELLITESLAAHRLRRGLDQARTSDRAGMHVSRKRGQRRAQLGEWPISRRAACSE
ncbi:hypothetical protein [Candidatus Poriferisodalis sp.]|uniref:hypothetical protein n=1 Tax=Candidatus Poriferisodalis sp. TaxID=3101277 RepID=UPI003B5A0E57